jgi:hypothetical protein
MDGHVSCAAAPDHDLFHSPMCASTPATAKPSCNGAGAWGISIAARHSPFRSAIEVKVSGAPFL